MNNLITVGSKQNETFIIEFRPVSKCNYSCYYCTDLHDNKHPVVNFEIKNLETVIKAVKKYKNRQVSLYIYGGEPTLHPKLTEYINTITTGLVDDIELQTNLSKSFDWFKRFIDTTDTSKLKISVSYHNTQRNTITDYIKKCMLLRSKGLLNLVSVMYNSRQCVLSDYQKLVKYLGQDTVELAPLIQQITRNDELDREIDYFYNNIDDNVTDTTIHTFNKDITYTYTTGDIKYSRNEIWRKRMNQFKGFTCHVPDDKLYIDWNGDCFSCVNDMFIPSDKLFNINEFSYKSMISHLKNNSRTCCHNTCPFDINSYKQVNET